MFKGVTAMFNGDINQAIENIIALYDKGGSPQQVLRLIQRL